MTRPTWDEYFLKLAEDVALRADCRRRQCGCVIVKNNRIVSTGYNGSPSGDKRSCLEGDCPRGLSDREETPGYQQGNHDYSGCIAIHSECNAILYASRVDTEGATIYITDPPCLNCWKLIDAAGIIRVVWSDGANQSVQTVPWTYGPRT